jgi:hypothetical protein
MNKARRKAIIREGILRQLEFGAAVTCLGNMAAHGEYRDGKVFYGWLTNEVLRKVKDGISKMTVRNEYLTAEISYRDLTCEAIRIAEKLIGQ